MPDTNGTNGNGDVTSLSYWLLYFAKQGPITLILAGITYGLFVVVVIPMRDDQKRYIDATIANNSQFAKSFSELQQTHATGFADLKQMHVEANRRLDAITTANHEQTGVLIQIRDEQRRGVWNEPKK